MPLIAPAEPSPQPIHAGQVLDSQHVTVEINTVFEQLTAVLSRIEPAKLNETLGAIAKALNGRGQKLGRALGDLDEFLTTGGSDLGPDHDIAVAPDVLNAYADAAPDLIRTADDLTRISQTIVDEQHNLDAFLLSAIGLADIGNDVVGTNRQALDESVLHLLVPTTDLTNRYNQALNCALAGMIPLAKSPPLPFPGVDVSVSFTLGIERYRYPHDLPKVAATGGPQCQLLPKVPMEAHPPFVVTDVGANPTQYGNQGWLLNSDALKQWLFGPIDGPPRNAAQIGQPG